MTLGLKQAVHNGVQDAAKNLTGMVRLSARQTGWSKRAARGLSFSADGSTLSVSASSNAAQDAEFGSFSTPPSPAMRKFANDHASIEEQILAAVEKHLKGVL